VNLSAIAKVGRLLRCKVYLGQPGSTKSEENCFGGDLKIMNSSKRLRVAVLTQDDVFVIPRNIALLASSDEVDLVSVVKIESKGAVSNKGALFLRGFGLQQVAKLTLLLVCKRVLDIVNRLLFFRLPYNTSLRGVAARFEAAYRVTCDPNSNAFIGSLERDNLDLIVSFSAPIVFGPALLSLPTHGCINLHCSLLPKYAGLLPSFWALYEGESIFGATVHMMDAKIDNGAILGQVTIEFENTRPSMYDVIKITKEKGGQLMTQIVNRIAAGDVEMTPNNVSDTDYRSWPQVSHLREFKASGGKLI